MRSVCGMGTIMNKKKCIAVVLAAGSGSRMKSKVAKQYMLLDDKPLIWYSLQAVEESSVIEECVLVTGEQDIAYMKSEIVEKYGFTKVSAVVPGGAQRYDSVANALELIANRLSIRKEKEYIFIHDGARPFLDEPILQRCYAAVEKWEACVVGMPVKDTVKIVDANGFAKTTPDRSLVWQVQTPQVFDAQLIIDAYAHLAREKENLLRDEIKITDDAMVVETFTGHSVKLIEGSYKNIKVTTPEDMDIALALLKNNCG